MAHMDDMPTCPYCGEAIGQIIENDNTTVVYGSSNFNRMPHECDEGKKYKDLLRNIIKKAREMSSKTPI